MDLSKWALLAPVSALNLKLTLKSGQVFTWSEAEDSSWRGVIGSTCFALKRVESDIYFTSHPRRPDRDFNLLSDFFQLGVDMQELYDRWSLADPTFAAIAESSRFQGLRICRQDPFECLMSFIVSQNNNAKRISSILLKIRESFGTQLLTLPDGLVLYSWPTLSAMAQVSEETWRDLGLGYRAKYFALTTKQLAESGGSSVLDSLRGSSIEKAREVLLNFTGVGRKVADCIALFSLDFSAVVPCDVHVFNIANRLYFNNKLKQKEHDKIQEKFEQVFGDRAGWAHSVLFASEFSGRKEFEENIPERSNKRNKISHS